MNLIDLTDRWVNKDRGNKPPKVTYRGECDDYAVTALYLLEGDWKGFWRALWKGDAAIVTGKSPEGGRHALLRYGDLYTDNWFAHWGETWYTKAELKERGYKLKKEYSVPELALRMYPALWGVVAGLVGLAAYQFGPLIFG